MLNQPAIPNSHIERGYIGYLRIIIIMSLLIRGFLAFFLELGNDEVYYWTYALYPDLSHFDHPPMIGIFIQLTTLNLLLDHEFFLRLSSVLLGGVNTWLIFLIGRRIKNSLAGLYAAILYNTSIYCFVIVGIFIMPDTPQVFFWLISLLLLVTILPDREIQAKSRRLMLVAGVVIGLAMLSKYTSAFLWLAAGLFILFYNRNWLKTFELYAAAMISLVIFSPVIWWNFQYNFISFTFHGERVSLFESGLRPDFFITELFGQILYNNPVNFIIIIIALIALFKKRFSLNPDYRKILFLSSIPLIGLFLFFALFRQTLPHWSGPGYLGLMLIAGVFFADMQKERLNLLPKLIKISIGLLLVGLTIGAFEIKLGIIGQPPADDPKRLGRHDVTLDMSEWKDFREKFSQLRDEDISHGRMADVAPVIITRWFPGAHLDYYVARHTGQNLIAIGDLKNLHKYAWINRERPGLFPGSDAYYITNSRDFKDPNPLLAEYFREIEEPVIVPMYKRNRHVQNFFIYRLRNCFNQPADLLEE
ncbi:MAG: glycosyltransferase family 39 protein [Bacteroidales bacterium]|nr:glycosyltransferase family 39 protein [Bacteroidales bacterium]